MVDLPFILLFIILHFTFGEPNKDAPMVKQGCLQKCGNISIPYPFGVGEECYRNRFFEIICNTSSSPSSGIPILQAYQLKVLAISFYEVRVAYAWKYPDCHPNATGMEIIISPSFRGEGKGVDNPFIFSPLKNKVVGTGCGILIYVENGKKQNYTGGCVSLCGQNKSVRFSNSSLYKKCMGYGCCQTNIPPGLESLLIRIHPIDGSDTKNNPNATCARAFIAERNISNKAMSKVEVPMSMSWVINKGSCEQKLGDNGTSFDTCGNNARCVNFRENNAHRCKCDTGYSGNPYLPDGCKDIDECKEDSHICAKIEGAVCYNIEGSYYCRCPRGYHNNSAAGSRCIS